MAHSTRPSSSHPHSQGAEAPVSRITRIIGIVRRRKLLTGVSAAILLLLFLGGIWLFKPAGPKYVTAVVTRGRLQQTVEAVGTITSERDLELKFPGAGIVESVFVNEGDSVAAGQVLARLRAGSLGAAVAMQAANVQAALADLRKLEEGTRPEDLAIAEAQVANRRASLQVAQTALASASQSLDQAKEQLKALQQEADITLSGQVQTAKATVDGQIIVVETALNAIDDVLAKTVVSDAIVKGAPGADSDIRATRLTATNALKNLRTQNMSVANYHDALAVLQAAQTAFGQAGNALDRLLNLVSTLSETSYFTAALREQYRTSLSTQRSQAQAAYSAVTTAYGNLQSASATYDTRISTAQSTITSSEGARDRAKADILTFQTALQAQEADLDSKKAGARQADLDSARARVRQAQAGLAQASATYGDTFLRAPVDGKVSHVNVKVGEATPVTGPAITVLGNSPFRVEMYISEVDVPKLQQTQTGSIELDAFPDVPYKLHVSEIDTAPTLVDNVSKYRVKLDFVYPHDEFKIGMTGDVTVVTGERPDVLKVPLRAVLTDAQSRKIVRILENGRVLEKPVTLGMEGESGDVEVQTGVGSGETIVVLQK